MAASLPNPSHASCIARLPVGKRVAALKKFSANANAPGAGKRQVKGRGRQGCARLAQVLGIYCIESTQTGALAASVGGASPATINTPAGTPTSTVIATNELDPVTYAAIGTKSLVVAVHAFGAQGQADLVIV